MNNLVDMKDMMTIKFRKIFPFDVYIATIDVVERQKEINLKSATIIQYTIKGRFMSR